MNDPYPTPPTGPKPETVSDTAKQAWESTKEKAGEALHSGERYVRENPATSVVSVFGFGFLLGVFVGWSLAHEAHESYATNALKLAKRLGHKLNLD